ncbi:hypothetical protein [Ottowia beijingensis]|uniref:hypothetical protein n=1 Tax=Ottowia beijingensis TaxID=1207057 RepID=UPI002FD9DC3D
MKTGRSALLASADSYQKKLTINKSQMTRGPHPLCGSGLARDPAWVATKRLIAGQPAATTLPETS